MFMTKRKKVMTYLQGMTQENRSAFDHLLAAWLDGTLKEKLSALGITRLELHVDWLKDVQCIGVQGRYGAWFLDLQIDPDCYELAFDLDEADEGEMYPLESVDQLFAVLTEELGKLK